MSLRKVSEADATPDKLVIYAQKGFGKTTIGAQAPKPIFFLSRGELGFTTLVRNGLAPNSPFVIIDHWTQLEAELRELIVKGCGDAQTLVLDALGGFERLCHEHICKEKFNGDWGEKGFMGFMRGYGMSVPEFTKALDLLDEVNRKLKLRIIVLAHTRVKAFNNPLGAAFDRYVVDCHEKTWEPLNGWADAVLFGKTVTRIAKIDGDNKGVGGTDRVIYTEYCDAFEAKNRHGLPKEIKMPTTPAGMWDAIGGPLAAAVKMGPAPAAPATSSDDGAKWDAAMMELTMLLKAHGLDGKLEAICKRAAVLCKRDIKTLDELTLDEIGLVVNAIRAKYETKAA